MELMRSLQLVGLGVLAVAGLVFLGFGVDRLRAAPRAHGRDLVRAVSYTVGGVVLSLGSGLTAIWWQWR
jgi:hypothetical protein